MSDNPKTSSVNPQGGEYWARIVKQWSFTSPPLRPSTQDVEFYTQAVQGWIENNGIPRVLLLGVTSEIYNLPWPVGTDFLAVDHNPIMIEKVWRGRPEQVQCVDWLDMDLTEASRDIVICDGGLCLLPFPEGLEKLAAKLHEVIAPGGIFVTRLFAPSRLRESTQEVVSAFLAGSAPDPCYLKLRLWSAMYSENEPGLPHVKVWEALKQEIENPIQAAHQVGWSDQKLSLLESWQHSNASVYLLPVDKIAAIFAERAGFELIDVKVPTYALGDCCPMIIFKRRLFSDSKD